MNSTLAIPTRPKSDSLLNETTCPPCRASGHQLLGRTLISAALMLLVIPVIMPRTSSQWREGEKS